MKYWKIRTRVMFLALAPATIIAVLLTLYFTNSKINDLESSLHERGMVIARHLATASEFGVVSGDATQLMNLLDATLRESDVYSAAIVDTHSNLIAGKGEAISRLVRLASASNMERIDVVDADDLLIFRSPVILIEPQSDDFLQPFSDSAAAEKISRSGSFLGVALVAMSRRHTMEMRNKMLWNGMQIVGVGLLLTWMAAAAMGRSVTRPIRKLSHAVEKLAEGYLDTRVDADSGGEILALETGVNKMAVSLQHSQEILQQSISDATGELIEQKEAAERANIAKSRFLAAASHDLRQPMHSLGLFVGALKERINYPEVSAIVSNIEASIVSMNMLFNALLDISKLDAGVVHPEPENFAINDVLDRMRMEFRPHALEKGLKFKVMPCHAIVSTDRLMLERILLNLVSNAIRYTQEGGVLVGCRRVSGEKIRIEVWDTGIGIPEASLTDVFQEFYQLGNVERDRNKGLGLGLAIVNRLGKMLNAHVAVRSVVGKGSVFSLEIPLGLKKLEGSNAAILHEKGSGKLELFVVVVDDDLIVLAGTVALLQSWGCEVLAADSGQKIVNKLLGQSRIPDVVLADYRLAQGDDGVSVIQAIQAIYSKLIPGVLISGDIESDRLRQALASGFPMLHKPVSPSKLRAMLMHISM
ncbi:response regulator [Sulfurirhabdus autotrophica]|uniref:histidine kinase n=1 Tax=Sulfurirhabdus autotrophica TaxID=1706046 RepID=A0A4R3XXZ8_9PROT|nr:response regulator [Sulfurirhabdus autotrophica]TCV83781.1 signal transduction histidine kinase [Sulfurirhabdus autotrophica]